MAGECSHVRCAMSCSTQIQHEEWVLPSLALAFAGLPVPVRRVLYGLAVRWVTPRPPVWEPRASVAGVAGYLPEGSGGEVLDQPQLRGVRTSAQPVGRWGLQNGSLPTNKEVHVRPLIGGCGCVSR